MTDRKLVISDIHGCYNEFKHVLNDAKYNPDSDQLILLGDFIDRGKDSNKVINEVISLVENYGTIALGGNHEEMFINWLYDDSDEEEEMYFPQGGKETLHSFFQERTKIKNPNSDYIRNLLFCHYEKEIEFIKQLPDYYEDESHIFVHAGVNLALNDWKNSTRTDFRWSRQMFWNQKNETGKTIIFGHTPTLHFYENEKICFDHFMFPCQSKIAIDGGCVFNGQLNCLEINPFGYKLYHVKRN